MQNSGRIVLLVAVLIAGNAASVFAQSRAHFRRVTTTAETDTRLAPSRNMRTAAVRDTRAFPRCGPGRKGGEHAGASLISSRSRSDVLHPYSAQSEAQSLDRESDGASRFSTWRDEPQEARPGPASDCSASFS